MEFRIHNAGIETHLVVPDDEVDEIHLPLLREIARAAGTRRSIVMIAGPPGSGKTTVCQIWSALAARQGLALAAVSQDGFHLRNSELNRLGLLTRKGAPETYDLPAMCDMLRRVREGETLFWPVYDRRLHEPVTEGFLIAEQKVVLIEGNYLLLDAPGWRDVRLHADLTVFLAAAESCLCQRILARHISVGRTREEAEFKLRVNDLPNIRRVNAHSTAADRSLRYDAVAARWMLERDGFPQGHRSAV